MHLIRGEAMRPLRFMLLAAALAVAAGAVASAQTRVKTQIVRPPAPAAEVAKDADSPAVTGSVSNEPQPAATPTGDAPEIITDLARLPPPVARMRERILAAARSGELHRLVSVMQSSATLPVFSVNRGLDPITYWKSNYPDSDGVEILATLIDILDTGFVHVDEGKPQDMYVWPYFARLPLKTLTASQKVDLFKIITGSDYKEMLAAGAYNFFRIGIASDGSWRFFVTGN